MKFLDDERIVMTLDAGGTNFVFSAIKGNKQIVDEIRLDSNADNLDKSLSNIIEGFQTVKKNLPAEPVAISFAFPGPADYPNGVLGDLGNLPAYRGGVALGPLLKEKFGLPVFINNDGDLFAYGEAIAGLLPFINEKLQEAGNHKEYKNLFGITLGTGFGSGIVRNEELYLGDNSMAGEILLFRNKISPSECVEEHASIRGVQRVFMQRAGCSQSPSPEEIYKIAIGEINGNKKAALEAFRQLGTAVGDALASAISLLDGIIVIGGGLSGSSSLLLPFIINEMNNNFVKSDGTTLKRLLSDVYNLENENDLQKFVENSSKEITIYGTDKKVKCDLSKKIGIGISKLGTSRAISIGAYAFALTKLDKEN